MVRRALSDLIYRGTGIAIRRRTAADRDEQLAVAALLAWVAGGDGSESTEEMVLAVELLRRRYGLSGTEPLEILTLGRDRYSGKRRDDLFALLNERFGLPDKQDLLVMLLDLVAVDGSKRAQEIELLAEAARRLKVPDSIVSRAYETYFEQRRSLKGRG
ncbi:MAG: TerB family tellurite resistance protein [Gammaproteobacteria bacterium]|nr:TerB family tellurite resistance protein [Gammaproteobacteria bacterium]MDH4254499.1 TerB family tellurite resistance protein [Gammaproteobacteria bacterium]MDH5309103.1 TerB family tellurite resistance protein [Gammaproteobacteria bacterium]